MAPPTTTATTRPPAAPDAGFSPARIARGLVRARDRAALSTVGRGSGAPDSAGWPHGSLVLTAAGADAAPLLLLSDLAEHTRNIAADSRVSLLYEAEPDADDPMAGTRAAVLGRAEPGGAEPDLRRFLARHPGAADYAGFADFRIWRVAVARAHVVAGFGRIGWAEGPETAGPRHPALEAAEAGIVEHMNADHADAVQLCAAVLLGLGGEGWRMTGCDPEGCDLRLGGRVARLAFDNPAAGPGAARAELVRLARRARSAAAGRNLGG